MAKVIWTDKAVSNLESIHSYISRDSQAYANRFIKEIIKRTSVLESFPSSGRIVPEFKFNWLRELVYENYRIVYTTKNHPDYIKIVTVFRCSQLLENLYDPDFDKNET